MQFGYKYHDHDGVVQYGEVGAPSREEAFRALRFQGIRPMQLWERVDGEGGVQELWHRRVRFVIVIGLVVFGVMALGVGYYVVAWGQSTSRGEIWHELRRDGGASSWVATPRTRHQCSVEKSDLSRIFAHTSEVLLAQQFARPGMPLVGDPERIVEGFPLRDLMNSLESPIVVEKEDSAEDIALKQVVVGLKDELALRMKGGQGGREAVRWLVERQKMESDYRQQLVRQAQMGELRLEEANDLLKTMEFQPIVSIGQRGKESR